MASGLPTLTIDLLIQVLASVIKENAQRDRGHMLTSGWTAETFLEDLGFDSFDFVELIFKIEDEFDVQIDYNANNSINDVKTIGDLCRELGKLVAETRSA